MKNVKQIRENYDLITEKEEAEDRKLASLVRAGLYDAKKLPALKKALEKSADKMTGQEKRMLLNLLDSLINQVVSNDQVFRKMKQNVQHMNEAKEDYLSKFDPRFKAGYPSDKDAPAVLILKRKAIRVYPDNQKVALYYSQALDKYVTIPFSDIQAGINEAVIKPKKFKKTKKYFGHDENSSENIKDTLALLKSRGEYSSKAKRVTALKSRGLNTAASLGVALVNDPIRKAITKARMKPIKPKGSYPSTKPPTVPESIDMNNHLKEKYKERLQHLREQKDLDENVVKLLGKTLEYGAKYGDEALKYGNKALQYGKKKASEYGKKAVDAWKTKRAEKATEKAKQAKDKARRQEVKDLSKERRGNAYKEKGKPKKRNIFRRVAGSAGRAARATLGLAAAAAGGAADGFQGSGPVRHQFSAKPKSVSSSDFAATTTTQDVVDRKLRRKADAAQVAQAQMNENVVFILKDMVDNNITEQTLVINEKEININNTVAKKIVHVYESVNSTNKKKMEKMLNESAESFTKVLTFAIRQ